MSSICLVGGRGKRKMPLSSLFFFPARPFFLSRVPLHSSSSSSLLEKFFKLDVYGKRQAAKIKLLPSVFGSLYSRIKIFVFAVNIVGDIFLFLYDLFKDNMKRIEKQR